MDFQKKEEQQFIKKLLVDTCRKILENRISNASNAAQQIQEDANSDQKSSAGDKHETVRAMAQIDIDMNSRQAEEARKQLAYFNTLEPFNAQTTVANGSVVVAVDEIYFIACGLGQLDINGKKVLAIASASPLALSLKGKKAGDPFTSHKGTTNILTVF